MENPIIQYIPKKPRILSWKVDLLIMSPILAILFFAGICKAYDMTMQWYFENAYKNAVIATHAQYASCESIHQAYTKWKSDGNLAINGTDGCNPLN